MSWGGHTPGQGAGQIPSGLGPLYEVHSLVFFCEPQVQHRSSLLSFAVVVTQGHPWEVPGKEKGRQGLAGGEEGSVWVTHGMGPSDRKCPHCRAIRNSVLVAIVILFFIWHSLLCSSLLQRRRRKSYPSHSSTLLLVLVCRQGLPQGAIPTKAETGAWLPAQFGKEDASSALFSAGW